MNDRQKKILKKIIENFIKNAEPLASGFLAGKINEKVSSATVRSEMVALEHDGFVFQPHTSAGRIPTEKAYQFYVENYLDKERKLNDKEVALLDEIKNQPVDDRLKIKNFAKAIANLSCQGVMVTFAECDNYYTGLSNIFSQPEFQDKDLVINLSSVVDHLDKQMADLEKRQLAEPEILVGHQNPIGRDCSLIVFKYQLGKFKGIIGLIGPMRMNYEKNYALVKESVKLLK
jgi:heat-inducible transcriptional repressor